MSSNVQTQRTFLIFVGGSLAVFVLMMFFFLNSGANAASPSQLNAAGDTAPVVNNQPAQNNGSLQDVYIKALATGLYDKQSVTVKKGTPVRLHFSAEPGVGCGRVLIMRKFGVQLISQNGEEQTATFTPNETGTFEYSCSMRMIRGSMTVVA